MIRAVLSLSVLISILVLPISAHADTLRGRVVDPDARPVAHALVIVTAGTSVVASVRTSADGRFGPVRLPAGAYDVIVAAPGLHAPATRITVAPGGTVDLGDVALARSIVTESVVVSSSQVEQPLSRVTDNVTVIDRQELLARQMDTVTDVLRLVPGFGVAASGGAGALRSVFPRGGESDYTLVLVDGLALNTFGGGFDAAHLSTAGVDRVEVVRGPASALFGGGAIGGLVHVITRQGGPTRGDVTFEAGSRGTTRALASAAGGRQAWAWGAAVERLASDGDTSFRSSIGGPVSNDDYERLVGSASLGWSDRATRRLRIDARVTRDDRGFPGAYGSDPFGFYGGLDTISRGINRSTGVSGSASLGDVRRVRHLAQAAWSSAPSRFLSPFGESEDRTRRWTGRYQVDAERARLGWSLGAESLYERADNTFITGEVFQPVPVTRSLTGLFAETRWRAGSRGAVTAGARLERIARNALEGNPSVFGPRPAFGTDVVWSANPKISASWLLRGAHDASGGWTRLRAGAGTGIKPPTAFEIAFTDNPSLSPERSRSVDVGVEHVFAGGLAAADATVFASRYDDLIVAVRTEFGSVSPYRTDNIANARAAGLELGVRWRSRGGLSARAAYTFMDTEVLAVDDAPGEAPSPFEVGQPLFRRARHQGSLDVRYTASRADVFLTVYGRGRTLDLEPNFASAVLSHSGHAVASLGGSVRLGSRLDAYGRIDNLFDRTYEDVLGFPAPGRTASVGLRVAVSR